MIDAATKERLETLLRNFEERTATQIALVTVTTLNDRPVEEYANELYRAWGISAKTGADKDKGALLLIALQDRKTRLEVGYGLEGDLPDGLAGEIIRRMRPPLQRQEYSQGLYVGTRTLIDTLAQKMEHLSGGHRRPTLCLFAPPSPANSQLHVLVAIVPSCSC